MRRAAIAGALLCAAIPWASAAAEPAPKPGAVYQIGGFDVVGAERDHLQLALGAGNVPITDRTRSGLFDEETTIEGRVEYRSGAKYAGFGPMAGALVNGDGSLFGYGALYTELRLGEVYFTPAAGIGAYEEGGGRDLGGVFQFHLGFDVAWRLDGGDRIGLKFAHISNAGLHESNPGTDSLLVTWTIPLGSF